MLFFLYQWQQAAAVVLIGDVPKEDRNFGAESLGLSAFFPLFFFFWSRSIFYLHLKRMAFIRETRFGLLVTFCFLIMPGGANLTSNPFGFYEAVLLRHGTGAFWHSDQWIPQLGQVVACFVQQDSTCAAFQLAFSLVSY